MSFTRGLIDFFFPVKCVACRSLIKRADGLLCETCAPLYKAATERLCPLCVKPLRECDCSNRYMKRNNLHTLVKLYRYQAGDSSPAENKIIYRLKKTTDITVMEFLAAELVPCIRRHMKTGKEYVLVGVPRSSEAIRRYGGDHTELLCRELSRRLDVPYIAAVVRCGRGKAQKTKRRRERIASAEKSYIPRQHVDLHGKCVILVDDVVTSGASLVACAKVLRRMGAKTIISAVCGISFRYHELISDAEFYAERKRKYGI